MKLFKSGFTLIELLVVISIVAILASVLYANFNEGSAVSRDAERQANLRTVQSGLELYKNRYGRYPDGCNGPGAWSGQVGTAYECNKTGGIYTVYDGTGKYIIGYEVGKDFSPDFIPVLPKDPKLNGGLGYVYRVNAEGTVYKFMSALTVETELMKVSDKHAFKSCDVSNTVGVGVCSEVFFAGNSIAPNCQDSVAVFRESYAVWGGYPFEPFPNILIKKDNKLELAICVMP